MKYSNFHFVPNSFKEFCVDFKVYLLFSGKHKGKFETLYRTLTHTNSGSLLMV